MNNITPPIPEDGFGCIVSDPPWYFAVRSPKGAGRSPDQHYNTMSLDDIKALPVQDWAAKDCVLLLWAIDPMLPQALEVINAWGFTFKTVGFYWAKTNRDGSPFTGMGYWTRANPEQCILATRGHPKRLNTNVRRLITSQRREHSRKPEEFYERVPQLCGGPYLDMFSRTPRPNWHQFGNQTDKFAEPTADATGPNPHATEPTNNIIQP